MAKREQKVCRKMWMPPVTFTPARRWARLIHLAEQHLRSPSRGRRRAREPGRHGGDGSG